MAKKFGFFNSINGDRKYLASDIAKAFDIGVSTGLKADKEDNLQIVPHENMIIKMLPGGAMIFGHYLLDEEEELITLDLADGELNRIDRIVLRYDKYERSIKTVVIKGTPALTPTAPAPLRTEEQFDLVLADIYVAKATTAITENNITDMRRSELCGFIGVKGAVSQIEFDAHLAESVSKVLLIDEPVNQITTTTVELGFRPKSIQIGANVIGQELVSEGKWAENGLQYATFFNKGASAWGITAKTISLNVKDGEIYIQGAIANATDTGFDIEWNKIGTMPGTTRRLVILATTH